MLSRWAYGAAPPLPSPSTLAKYLSGLEHPLGEKEILDMFAQMAAALEYLHSRKILHRSLSITHVCTLDLTCL